jgi:hypothetical protein
LWTYRIMCLFRKLIFEPGDFFNETAVASGQAT